MPETLTEIYQATLDWVAVNGWVMQVFIVVLAALLVSLAQRVAMGRLIRRLERTRNTWDDALVGAMQKPLTLVIYIVGIAYAAEIIYLETQASIFSGVDALRDVGIVACIGWFLMRFVRDIENNIIRERAARGETDRTTVEALSKLVRAAVIITTALVGLQTLGFSISGVLAFGGIGGIAIGFAAKDLLANFFGGLMIYLDRPFEVGHWIYSPDQEIEGTVEEIGWRLTRIRTFDKRPMYVPNAVFSTISVVNPSRMSNRRIYETIGVRYDDFAVLPKVIAEVRAMLEGHPEIDQDQTLMVFFNAFGASSLDFMVYTFTRTVVWKEYHRVKEDVLLKIAGIIERHGAEVAFPTRTLHLPGMEGAVAGLAPAGRPA